MPSQRRFPFAELQIISIRMHLNIPFLYTVSAIFYFWHLKPSASHAGENAYLSRLVYLIPIHTV